MLDVFIYQVGMSVAPYSQLFYLCWSRFNFPFVMSLALCLKKIENAETQALAEDREKAYKIGHENVKN